MKPSFRLSPLTTSLALVFSAHAQTPALTPAQLPEVRVVAAPLHDQTAPSASDATALLRDKPGYAVATGGGVSGLPVMNGFADDRLKVSIDGMEITSACANHMNTPLSYIAPQQVGSIRMLAGIVPVSAGGDSIGGSIEVQSRAPAFARPGSDLLSEGRVSFGARSVNRSVNVGLEGTLASENLSLSYAGAYNRGRSYKDGNGDKVLASMYESNNQSIMLAARGEGQLIKLRIGEQRIPFQGYPNQYMDMTGNRAVFANLGYFGDFSWGTLDAKLYWQETDHSMGFFSTEKRGTMPMNTSGRNLGYTLKAELPLQDDAKLRIGNEYHSFRLDDWWPPVAGSMMMGPGTFLNINNGERERLAFYAEWEGKLAPQWSGLFGIRDEIVTSDAGAVQPYGNNMMQAADVAAAAAFNASSRGRRDNNVDLTALLRFEPDPNSSYEFGYARKTRSPNLYERYAWGRGTMAMMMNNWFGDGNGYVGDLDLKPEVAHTLSATADWHDTEKQRWSVTLNPYYSRVKNYIDTDVVGAFNPFMLMSANGNLLKFANHDAKLYGINLSWKLPLFSDTAWGDWRLRGNASLTRGSRSDGGELYRMMPFNALLALEQSKAAWTNVVEARVVTRKDRVDNNRLEPVTAGYAIVNVRTAYQLTRQTTLSAGISNLFDKAYADPLGGVYLSGLKSSGMGPLVAVPGYGRSLDIGVSIGF